MSEIVDGNYVEEILQRLESSDLKMEVTISSREGIFYMSSSEESVALQGTTLEEAVTYLGNKITCENPSSNFSFWWKEKFGSSL
ncbi:MAG: hypothetical protein L0Y35_07070 [Flammeovirgaceae bacterium]|nr:hypothetical protein [Flammeovirgaceae bacterium]